MRSRGYIRGDADIESLGLVPRFEADARVIRPDFRKHFIHAVAGRSDGGTGACPGAAGEKSLERGRRSLGEANLTCHEQRKSTDKSVRLARFHANSPLIG